MTQYTRYKKANSWKISNTKKFANNHAQKSYSLQLLPSQTFIIQNSFLPSVKHFCLRLIKTHDYQNSHLLEDKNKPFKQCLTELSNTVCPVGKATTELSGTI